MKLAAVVVLCVLPSVFCFGGVSQAQAEPGVRGDACSSDEDCAGDLICGDSSPTLYSNNGPTVCLKGAVPIDGTLRLPNGGAAPVPEPTESEMTGDVAGYMFDTGTDTWPLGSTVTYCYMGADKAEALPLLKAAADDWNQHINLRFEAITDCSKANIRIGDDDDQGCASYLGAQIRTTWYMNLAEGCWASGTVLHEFGHALGLMHEHKKPNFELIFDPNEREEDWTLEEFHHNYDKELATNEMLRYSTGVDWASVMLYPIYPHEVLNEPAGWKGVERNEKISPTDIVGIKLMYPGGPVDLKKPDKNECANPGAGQRCFEGSVCVNTPGSFRCDPDPKAALADPYAG